MNEFETDFDAMSHSFTPPIENYHNPLYYLSDKLNNYSILFRDDLQTRCYIEESGMIDPYILAEAVEKDPYPFVVLFSKLLLSIMRAYGVRLDNSKENAEKHINDLVYMMRNAESSTFKRFWVIYENIRVMKFRKVKWDNYVSMRASFIEIIQFINDLWFRKENQIISRPLDWSLSRPQLTNITQEEINRWRDIFRKNWDFLIGPKKM